MKTKFLLADDDPDDCSLFCEAVLEVSSDMECRTVENGRKLFELLTTIGDYFPDVIFLDINMPLMDGWECLKVLKHDQRYQNIPIIIYSTSSIQKDIDRAYQLGADLFITKPENFEDLRQIVKIIALDSNRGLALAFKLRKFGSIKVI